MAAQVEYKTHNRYTWSALNLIRKLYFYFRKWINAYLRIHYTIIVFYFLLFGCVTRFITATLHIINTILYNINTKRDRVMEVVKMIRSKRNVYTFSAPKWWIFVGKKKPFLLDDIDLQIKTCLSTFIGNYIYSYGIYTIIYNYYVYIIIL